MTLTEEERAKQAWGPGRLEEVVATFKRDGYVTIEEAIPRDFIAEVRAECLTQLEAKMTRFERESRGRFLAGRAGNDDPRLERNDGVSKDLRPAFYPEGGNQDLNRWSMHLPSRMPFFDPRMIDNPFAMPVLQSLLGDDFLTVIVSSNTPLPNSSFQTPHNDTPRFRIGVDIPLMDVTDENAPIELWPGTHRPPDGDFSAGMHQFRPPDGRSIEDFVQSLPSKRLTSKAGTIILRDLRMVHRGTANRSNEPRPMYSLVTGTARPAPAHRAVSDISARVALRIRERARSMEPSEKRIDLLVLGNGVGGSVDCRSGSDRNYRRPIPRDLWETLSPRARRMLRYADVTDGGNQDPTAVCSVLESVSLATWVAQRVGDAARILYRRRNGRPRSA